ncbi:MAG TPA: cupin domain-containing protein [Segetibacter sp.]|jgi:quercetin dioxygenase-like cupin family protein
MPFVDINTLHEKEVIAGYRGRTIHTGTMTFMYWTVDEGAIMPAHFHVHEQVAHVLKGKFELTIAGKTQLLQPGQVAVIPSNIPHSGKAITDCELLDVFNPEREDYKF